MFFHVIEDALEKRGSNAIIYKKFVKLSFVNKSTFHLSFDEMSKHNTVWFTYQIIGGPL